MKISRTSLPTQEELDRRSEIVRYNRKINDAETRERLKLNNQLKNDPRYATNEKKWRDFNDKVEKLDNKEAFNFDDIAAARSALKDHLKNSIKSLRDKKVVTVNPDGTFKLEKQSLLKRIQNFNQNIKSSGEIYNDAKKCNKTSRVYEKELKLHNPKDAFDRYSEKLNERITNKYANKYKKFDSYL